jgi:hypothetical protein
VANRRLDSRHHFIERTDTVNGSNQPSAGVVVEQWSGLCQVLVEALTNDFFGVVLALNELPPARTEVRRGRRIVLPLAALVGHLRQLVVAVLIAGLVSRISMIRRPDLLLQVAILDALPVEKLNTKQKW